MTGDDEPRRPVSFIDPSIAPPSDADWTTPLPLGCAVLLILASIVVLALVWWWPW